MKNLTCISKMAPSDKLVEAAKECGFSVHFADASHVHSDVEIEYFVEYLSAHDLCEDLMFGAGIELYMVLTTLSMLVDTCVHLFVGGKLITFNYQYEQGAGGLYRRTS